MSYLHKGLPTLNVLASHGDETETKEYMKIIGNKHEKMRNFSIFWRKRVNKIFENDHSQMIGKAASEYILESIPSDEELEKKLQSFQVNSKNNDIIFYEHNKFKRLIKEADTFLISQEIINVFKFSKFFNFKEFSSFVKLSKKIYIELADLLSCSTVEGLLLSRNDLIYYVEEHLRKRDFLDFLANELDFYAHYVVSLFSYYFDPFQTGTFDPFKMIYSSYFIEFYQPEGDQPDGVYSFASFFNIFEKYNDIVNDNGMVDKESIRKLNECFTNAFIDRIFEISNTYNDSLDFDAFIKFYIPFTQSKNKNAGYYFFKLLDIDNDGLISISDLSYFYNGCLKENETKDEQFNIFLMELFDQSCSNQLGITLKQFINFGDNLFGILMKIINFKFFEDEIAKEEEEENFENNIEVEDEDDDYYYDDE